MWFHMNFLDLSSSVNSVMGNLIGIALNLQIALGSMAILMILILPIQEHGISFHFFESPLISLINILQFSAYKSLTSLVRFTPKYLTLRGVILKSIVFLYSFPNICFFLQIWEVSSFSIISLYFLSLSLSSPETSVM